ncbi:DEAD/DEAH box helicase family protein [Francisella tularensis]|uniref:DEAD/DEAH box helicase family protein n=1 Tax=Francisella tularensis TaxID=263 RepID=UPI001F106DCE|nr:DEAD/DEAH box helicase family protein [Francisella tularensis]WKL71415.1 DEAD/DEAH box helicase family protein [Francisella tularensis subsp. mediasiatica]WKL72258.1 DEAD/DEAH box helicase family protein [Francisella tularensis subsp. mediasiatica]
MLYNNIKKWIPLSSSGMTVRVSSNMTEPNLSFRGLTTESITEKANDNCESSNTMKKLKLDFDNKQSHQLKAIDSIVKLFDGQTRRNELFTVEAIKEESGQYSTDDKHGETTGYGNKLSITSNQLLENLQKVQLENSLDISSNLHNNNFTIEMETGNGKTYVYLRSILQLNKDYGFTKFIIVVPSVAIRESVKKALEITKEHFKKDFENEPYDYFVYDSAKLGQIRDFATNSNIQIMVMNMDAFNKNTNKIFEHNDRLQGRPIDMIKGTNPFVIIDEPQSVDTTDKAKDAIAQLNPLCTFRFSATHKDIYNLIYKLDPIDAYQQGLVKQIEIFFIIEEESFNHPYIKLDKVKSTKTKTTAEILVDIQQKNNVARVSKKVEKGVDLEDLTGRSIYQGYIIDDVYTEKGKEYIRFTNGKFIRLGDDNSQDNQSYNEYIKKNDSNEFNSYNDFIKKCQIRKTIDTHLDRELEFAKNGIDVKILSLFFIDRVANYRDYETEDQKGRYARWFEEEYTKAIKLPKYETLFEKIDTDLEASQVHEGYFSSDKNGLKDTTGTTKADESTYDLIMRNKEKLLSKSEPIKFIFSHSVLKEGWDNPNVFQICTLNETKSEMKKCQEIGRGLRLCVGQDGKRIFDKKVNMLTVMVNEHYQNFVESLQKEIEEEGNVKFELLQHFDFAKIQVTSEEDKLADLGREKSKEIFKHCQEKGYIDSKGKITDELKIALKNDTLEVPEDMQEHKQEITQILQSLTKNLDIKNARASVLVKPKKEVLLSPEFKQLWDNICHKTQYRVNFDNHKLVNACVESIKANISIHKRKVETLRAKVDVSKAGTEATEVAKDNLIVNFGDQPLPDILTYLQNGTGLKRQTIAEILSKSNKFKDF